MGANCETKCQSNSKRNSRRSSFGALWSIVYLIGGLNPSEKYESQLGWLVLIVPHWMGKIRFMFQSPPTRYILYILSYSIQTLPKIILLLCSPPPFIFHEWSPKLSSAQPSHASRTWSEHYGPGEPVLIGQWEACVQSWGNPMIDWPSMIPQQQLTISYHNSSLIPWL